MNLNQKFISESELGRRLNCPAKKLKRALVGLGIAPEITACRLHLYSIDHLDTIRRAIDTQAEVCA